MTRRTRFFLRLAFGAAVLVVLVASADFSGLTLQWSAGLAVAIAVGTAFILLAQAVAALRWRVILGAGAPPWLYLTRLYYVGTFFSLFLPSSVGGDAVRAAAAARTLGRPSAVVTSVVVDRALGVAALLGYLLIGIVAAPDLLTPVLDRFRLTMSPVVLLAGGAAAALLFVAALAYLVRKPSVRAALAEAVALLRSLGTARGIGITLGLSFVVQGSYIASWYALGRGSGLELSPALYLVDVPLVSLAAMMPVTISGLGIREGFWIVALAPYGVASGTALTFSLLYFLCFMIVGVIGGLLFVGVGTAHDGLTADPDASAPAAQTPNPVPRHAKG